LMDASGRIVGASKIARDVTDKRRHEERRQLLINELNHRVKNTLATVQSLAAQTFRGETQTRAFGQFESRLVALSSAHDVLTEENWEGADLRELIERTISPICVNPQRIDISGPALRLRPKVALSLSMAFHELCTNAVKYGALVDGCGRIKIGWEAHEVDSERRLHLRWEESGGPKVEKPQHKGFGSRLLERALCHELGTQVELTFAPTGVVCEIETPLT
jgi:two-component sensor histidine kinase